MSRKRFGGALALAAAIGTAAFVGVQSGHAQPASARAFPTGPVHLTMWWWGEQEAAGAKKWLAQTIKLYEKKHPNVTISTVLETTDGLIPSFKAAAAAKKGPDIEYFWGGIWALGDAWAGNTKPVSDYIPMSELKHYLNIREDTYQGKVWTAPWYVQPSFPVLYRKDVLAKAGIKPPTTWTQLMAACTKLSSQGIIPMAGGIKDGWFGGWLYSLLAGQNLRSLSDLLAAVGGQKKFTDPEFALWWQKLQDMRDHKCWNNDINSQQLYQGQQEWAQGKAAMTITAGSDVKKFVQQVGVSKVGVMPMPTWAHGPYAGKLGATSQTLGITAWTKYPEVDADFIMFMHTPERMASWFKITGAFPADSRFNTKLITLPQQKALFALLQHPAPYLENFIPTELDSKANFGEAQLLLGGSIDWQKAAQATEQFAQRIRLTQRSTIADFKTWGNSYK